MNRTREFVIHRWQGPKNPREFLRAKVTEDFPARLASADIASMRRFKFVTTPYKIEGFRSGMRFICHIDLDLPDKEFGIAMYTVGHRQPNLWVRISRGTWLKNKMLARLSALPVEDGKKRINLEMIEDFYGIERLITKAWKREEN